MLVIAVLCHLRLPSRDAQPDGAGVAQVGLYAAVLAPLFWVPRLTSIDMRMLRRAVMILWGFHGLSAGHRRDAGLSPWRLSARP